MKTVYFKKLDPRAIIPKYQTKHSAGMDLHVIIDTSSPLIIDQSNPPDIEPGNLIVIERHEVVLLRTGLAIEMAPKMEAQIRPRSGLALQYPNYIANSPGTIDSDYRGEIKIPFINNTNRLAVIKHGDRIAQIIFSRLLHIQVEEKDELSNTQRNAGGFGHTGL